MTWACPYFTWAPQGGPSNCQSVHAMARPFCPSSKVAHRASTIYGSVMSCKEVPTLVRTGNRGNTGPHACFPLWGRAPHGTILYTVHGKYLSVRCQMYWCICAITASCPRTAAEDVQIFPAKGPLRMLWSTGHINDVHTLPMGNKAGHICLKTSMDR